MSRLQIKETLSLKKSSFKKHVSSVKDIKSLENIKKTKKKDQNIKDLLGRTRGGATGSTLLEDMKLYIRSTIRQHLYTIDEIAM